MKHEDDVRRKRSSAEAELSATEVDLGAMGKGAVEGLVPELAAGPYCDAERQQAIAQDVADLGRRCVHGEVAEEHPTDSVEPTSTQELGEAAGSGTRDVIEHALAAHGLTMAALVVEHTTATAVREAVLAGGSPAFLSRRAMARELASGHLAVVPTPSLGLDRVSRAVWVGGRNPPAGPARDLVGIARAALRERRDPAPA